MHGNALIAKRVRNVTILQTKTRCSSVTCAIVGELHILEDLLYAAHIILQILHIILHILYYLYDATQKCFNVCLIKEKKEDSVHINKI